MVNGQKYPRQWENVNSSLQRLRLPGMWLIRSTTTLIVGDKEVHASESLHGIEDPNFEWILEKE